MSRRGERLQVFVATKGHAFARDPFEAMLRAEAIEPTFVDHPAAAMLMNPDALRGFDAVLLYDMPGMDFRAPVDVRPEPVAPPAEFVRGFERLLAEGKGIVALHHAIAAWPAWPAYADALGGAFLYRPGTVKGVPRPASGYVGAARYTIVKALDHPILDGIPERFEIEDEPYIHEIFAADVTPLLRREPVLSPGNFHSACDRVRRVPQPQMCTDWGPIADPTIGWIRRADRSPVVYLQPGDGPAAYGNPAYRRLVGNALRWAASAEAAGWSPSAPD